MPLDALRLPLQSHTFVRAGRSWFSGFLQKRNDDEWKSYRSAGILKTYPHVKRFDA